MGLLRIIRRLVLPKNCSIQGVLIDYCLLKPLSTPLQIPRTASLDLMLTASSCLFSRLLIQLFPTFKNHVKLFFSLFGSNLTLFIYFSNRRKDFFLCQLHCCHLLFYGLQLQLVLLQMFLWRVPHHSRRFSSLFSYHVQVIVIACTMATAFTLCK